jgi:hypothetical protein
MSDLKRILEVREPLYRKADLTVDTSSSTVDETAAVVEHEIRKG